ncbi:hypothetical protein J8J14_14495 [Roseomonas sp. SSH11]|uniref:General stress protein n=1 Tax=Pararoseomonas baculiformis TaxID=2820812 RepID=A0ABS4AG58_9PROT|nr:hypothetical protein [Pararoseomonas baculiformis]MBP0445983.1 hypothetical protein [Pararoseomonas baculiformis]
MADKQKSAFQEHAGKMPDAGNSKGGGNSKPGGDDQDIVGNARLKGEDPSPDNRKRGQTS